MKNKTYDNQTTAERSIENKTNITKIVGAIQQISDVVNPDNLTFGDGKLVNEQATIAEDIVSTKDLELETLINQNGTYITTINETLTGIDTSLLELENEILANTQLIGDNVNDIENLEVDIEEVNGDIGTINSNLNTMNTRVQALENENLTNITDYAVLPTLYGSVQDDYLYLNNDIDEITLPTYGEVWNIEHNSDLDRTQINILEKSTIEIKLDLTLSSTTAPTPTLTFEVIDSEDNILKTIEKEYSFGNEISIYTGLINLIVKDIEGGTSVYVRVKSNDSTVSISEGEMLITLTRNAATISELTDTDIISTTNLGNTTVRGDIVYLDSSIDSLDTRVSQLEQVISPTIDSVIVEGGLIIKVYVEIDGTFNNGDLYIMLGDYIDSDSIVQGWNGYYSPLFNSDYEGTYITVNSDRTISINAVKGYEQYIMIEILSTNTDNNIKVNVKGEHLQMTQQLLKNYQDKTYVESCSTRRR